MNHIKENLIGKIAIVEYNNKRFQGIIIKETKSTITLRTDSDDKNFIKSQIWLTIKKLRFPGTLINKNPEDRINK